MTPEPPPRFLATVRQALEDYAARQDDGGLTQVAYVADRLGLSKAAAQQLIGLLAEKDRAHRDALYIPGGRRGEDRHSP